MKIAFIGFGEAARAFRASLSAEQPGLHGQVADVQERMGAAELESRGHEDLTALVAAALAARRG